MENNKVESQNMSNEEDDCVRIVALNEDQEATTENLEAQNTQYVLEIEPANTKKKNTKGKTLITTQKKNDDITNSPLIRWLANFWQTEATLRVNETIFEEDQRLSSENEEHAPIQCGANFSEDNEGFFCTYEDTPKELNRVFLQYFRGVVLKRRIIHDVAMVASHARAHSLATNTGRISQSILIREDDGYINISSPGERGSMVIKLELYPFKECVKLNKNQYWTRRTYSCLGVSSGEESRVHKLAIKLRYELTKQVMNLKNVKVEKRYKQVGKVDYIDFPQRSIKQLSIG